MPNFNKQNFEKADRGLLASATIGGGLLTIGGLSGTPASDRGGGDSSFDFDGRSIFAGFEKLAFHKAARFNNDFHNDILI